MLEDEILLAFKSGKYTAEETLEFIRQSKLTSQALTEEQHGLWLLQELDADLVAYNVPFCVKLAHAIDVALLQKACEKLVQRHRVLTSTVVQNDGEPSLVQQPELAIDFHHQQIGGLSEQQQLALLDEKANLPFDLKTGPLIRFSVFSQSEDQHLLLVVVHHIVFDGSSIPNLLKDLFTAYLAEVDGQAHYFKPLPACYADFVQWQQAYLNSRDGKDSADFWLQHLSDQLPVLKLSVETESEPGATPKGRNHSRSLSAFDSTLIKSFCQSNNINHSVLFLAPYLLLLQKYCAEQDIIVGMPTRGRPEAKFDDLVGYFINMIPLRNQIDDSLPLMEFLAQLAVTMVDGMDHSSYPFPRLVSQLNIPQENDASPVFQVEFVFQNSSMVGGQSDPGNGEESRLEHSVQSLLQSLEVVDDIQQKGEFKLSLEIMENQDTFGINFKYDGNRFSPDAIKSLAQHYCNLLDEMLDKPDICIGEYSMLSKSERSELIHTLNKTSKGFPRGECVHSLIEQQAALTPDATAVVFDDQQLTYAQLNAKANQVAHYLVSQQVKPDDLVVLSVGPSLQLMIGMLAIIKAGATYVPLEPTLPGERIQIILEDSGANIVLCTDDLATQFSHTGSHLVFLDTGADNRGGSELFSQQPESNVSPEQVGLTPDNGLYVIYTSGSTGKPKGVMVEHRAEVNLMSWYRDLFGMSQADKVMITSAMGFDLTQKNFFTPLCCGAAVYLSSAHLADTVNVRQFIKENQITFINCTPSVFYALADHADHYGDLHSLTGIVTGGEVLSYPRIEPWLQSAKDEVKFVNMYGPTECTDISSYYVIEQGFSGDAVPVGRPMDNVQLYVLDEKQQLLPKGLVGELYIGGVGVARGYYQNPQLTDEKYITNPFNPKASQQNDRLYKTGDLVRYRSDGNVEFVGRIDNQVKVRGYRIELAEIESRLMAIASVSEVAVITSDVNDSTRLVAYITPENAVPENQQHSYIESLRQQLSEHLPNYMLPSAFVLMARLPLTPNGKVDRRKLPEPDSAALVQTPYEAPQGETETALAALWREILDLDRVGRQGNFFDLGGHSLMATSALAKVNATFAVQLSLADFMNSRNLQEMAQLIDSSQETETDFDRDQIMDRMDMIENMSDEELEQLLNS